MVVAYMSIDYTPQSCISLLAFGILGVLGLMCVAIRLACTPFTNKQMEIRDYLVLKVNISHSFNTISLALIDAVLVLALPFCLWKIAIFGFQFAKHFGYWDEGNYALDVEYGILTLIPGILSIIYLIIFVAVAICHKIWGIKSLRVYTSDKIARRQHCSDFLFNHSCFRKHSYVF